MKRLTAATRACWCLVAAGCQGSKGRAQGTETSLRLGIFPNLTHAPGLVALASGILEETLAPTKVDLKVFNSGKEAQTAILAGSLDATYIGPAPTATLYLKSKKVAVVSGAIANGASFVVRRARGSPSPPTCTARRSPSRHRQHAGHRAAGLAEGARPDPEGGRRRRRDPGGRQPAAAPGVPLRRRRRGVGAGALAEPPDRPAGLATELVDETELWPTAEFLTTNLIASTGYLDAHPDVSASWSRPT